MQTIDSKIASVVPHLIDEPDNGVSNNVTSMQAKRSSTPHQQFNPMLDGLKGTSAPIPASSAEDGGDSQATQTRRNGTNLLDKEKVGTNEVGRDPAFLSSPRGNVRRAPHGGLPTLSLRNIAMFALASSGMAMGSRPDGAARGDLALSGAPASTHDLSPLLSEMANQAVTDSPKHVHEPSPLESAGFQEKCALPVSAAAVGLAVTSLPIMYVMGKKGKDSLTETAATREDVEAAGQAASTEEAGSASVDTPATRAQSTTSEPSIASTLPTERRFSAMLVNVATGIWKQTDLYTGLHAGEDKEFRERMMNPLHGQMSLPQRKAQLIGWANDIAQLDLPGDLKKHFRESIQDTSSAIEGLIENTNPWSRGAKLVAQAILCTPLPIVLPLFAVPIERQQMDVIIASYVKTTMLRGGLAMRATANNAAITNLYLNRDYANVIQSIALSLNLFSKTRGIADNPAYSVGAATASAIALAYTFYPDQVKSMPRHIMRAMRQVASFITGNGLLPPHEQPVQVGGIDIDSVSGENKANLQALSGKVFEAREELASQRRVFKDAEKTLSDTADWQFGQMLKGYYNLARQLEAFTASTRPAGGRVHDPDRTAKLALAIMSGTICVGVTAEFYQNKITAVDMGVDALFNIYNSLNQALDPNVSWQQSLDTFKNWTSLSLVMAPMQAGNLRAGNLVEQSDRNMLIGSGTLTAANLLVAGPFGAAVKMVVGKALDCAQREAPLQLPPLEMTARAQPSHPMPPEADLPGTSVETPPQEVATPMAATAAL